MSTLRELVAGVIRDKGQAFVRDWTTNDDQFRHEASKKMAVAVEAVYANDRRKLIEAAFGAGAKWCRENIVEHLSTPSGGLECWPIAAQDYYAAVAKVEETVR
jgi:hypothetical protein